MYGENDMSDKTILINVDDLRDAIRNEYFGAYFEGGFGGALVESFDVNGKTPDELVEMAKCLGIDLSRYQM
jgi:hypothetical protein